MEGEFKYLFTPLRIGGITIRNRIVSSAHMTGYGENNLPSDRLLYYHRDRAKGGVGLIITEVMSVHFTSPSYRHTIKCDNDAIIPWFNKIAEAVHEHGAKIFGQLSHFGRIVGHEEFEVPIMAPSPIRPERFHIVPREMEIEDIKEIILAFGRSAKRIKEGGLDGVELQMAHGYLINQFLSPHSNRRTDKYGGSIENRLRFACEVMESVRENVGTDFVVGIKISGDEFVNGGLTLDDMREIVPKLVTSGKVDFVDVSASNSSEIHSLFMHIPPMGIPLGNLIHLAAGIKEVVNIPIICVGRINDPIQAEKILDSGYADMVGMVRANICDPEFPKKAREGRSDDILTCVACNQGCIERLQQNKSITCIQNPSVGREKEWGIGNIMPATTPKKVLIAGGGPAGLKAAAVAALRGHRVALFDKEEELGGQVRIAAKAPFREEFVGIVRYLSHQLEKLKVEVNLGNHVTVETIEEQKADAVVIATGSIPTIPKIPGGDQILSVYDVLEGKVEVGKNIMILDDESFRKAPSAAELLADMGKNVEIITKSFFVGSDMGISTNLVPLYQRLFSKGIVLTPNTWVNEISGDRITVYNIYSGIRRVIEKIDTIIVASHNQADNMLYRSLKGRVKELYAIGDCVAPRRVENAIYDGFVVGAKI